MLLVPDSTFGDSVMIQLETWVIDITIQVITKKELPNASNWWRRKHLSSVISRWVNVKAGPTELLLDLSPIQQLQLSIALSR